MFEIFSSLLSESIMLNYQFNNLPQCFVITLKHSDNLCTIVSAFIIRNTKHAALRPQDIFMCSIVL
jgi:hypothetical protein